MSRRSRISVRFVVASAAILLALTGFATAMLPGTHHNTDEAFIAVPAGIYGPELRNALLHAGAGPLLHEDDIFLPLSNFASMELATVPAIRRRLIEGDPRSTPLLEVLGGYFRVPSPDGNDMWDIVHIGNETDPETLSAVMGQLGTPWAVHGLQEHRFNWFSLLPPGIWLVVVLAKLRKTHPGVCIATAITMLPLLAVGSPVAALAAVCLSGIVVVAGVLGKFFWLSGVARMVVPSGVTVVFAAAVQTEMVPLLGLSVLAGAAALRFLPLLERLGHAWWTHQPPAFVALTPEIPRRKVRTVLPGAMLPVAAAVVVMAVQPAGMTGNDRQLAPFILSVEKPRYSAESVTAMYERHERYQEAITWGRLGEADWENGSYTLPPSYGFTDIGTLLLQAGSRTPGNVSGSARGPQHDIIAILTGPRPERLVPVRQGRTVEGSRAVSQAASSALP